MSQSLARQEKRSPSNVLTPLEPGYVSGLEQVVGDGLDLAEMPYEKNALVFDLECQNGAHTFTPDYHLTKDTIGFTQQKEVLVESHGSQYFDEFFLSKLQAFMKSEHHKKYFLVVIADSKYSGYLHNKMDTLHLKPEDIADKLLIMDFSNNKRSRAEQVADVASRFKVIKSRGNNFADFWNAVEKRR